jgi:predicted PurR-regulated permease PerM
MKKNITIKEMIFPILVILFFVVVFYFAKKTFFILVLSVSFAYLLNPVVKFFEVRGINRAYVVSMIYLIAGIFILGLLFIVINLASIDIQSFINDWPNYYAKFESVFSALRDRVIKLFPFLQQFNFNEKINNMMILIPGYLISFLPSLAFVVLVPFVAFFILIKGDKMLDIVLDHIPSRYVEIILHIVSRVDNTLGNYLGGVISEAFVLFIIAFFGLFLLGINYFSIIAIIVGIFSVGPYLGAILGVVISSIIAFMQYNDVSAVIKVLIFFGALRMFDGWVLQPYIMKRNTSLNPAAPILSLIAGGEIAGFCGIVFAVPVVCISREIISIVMEFQKTEFSWTPEAEPSRINIPYT